MVIGGSEIEWRKISKRLGQLRGGRLEENSR